MCAFPLPSVPLPCTHACMPARAAFHTASLLMLLSRLHACPAAICRTCLLWLLLMPPHLPFCHPQNVRRQCSEVWDAMERFIEQPVAGELLMVQVGFLCASHMLCCCERCAGLSVQSKQQHGCSPCTLARDFVCLCFVPPQLCLCLAAYCRPCTAWRPGRWTGLACWPEALFNRAEHGRQFPPSLQFATFLVPIPSIAFWPSPFHRHPTRICTS